MRVALITPRGAMFGKGAPLAAFLQETGAMETFRRLWTGPNLGLITIAAMLPVGCDAVYIDENYSPVDLDAAYDLVCLSAMTQQAPRAYEIADQFRARGVRTVMGGIHATVEPEEAASHADTVVVGEAEGLFAEFLADFLAGRPRRFYRHDATGSVDLSTSPTPRYDLLPVDLYPLITIQTTRGCPHDCSFCAASKVYGPRYRVKTVDQVLAEVQALSRVRPSPFILFADDNMFVMRRFSRELLERLAPLRLRWIGQTDISIAKDPDFLDLMVRAGCQWVVIGFESVTAAGLEALDRDNWKLRQLGDYARAIATIQDHGVGVYGTFIVGLDADDASVFQRTADFIAENNLYGFNVTVPTPLPGTAMRQRLLADGRVTGGDWSNYTLWDVNITPRRMSAGELEEGLLRIYRGLYTPEHVQRRLRHFLHVVARRPAVSGGRVPGGEKSGGGKAP